jgi:hypothetical protein
MEKSKIEKFMTFWPSDIFYDDVFEYHRYDTPRWQGGGFLEGPTLSRGYCSENREYTKLGKWFASGSPVKELIKLPYYLITFPFFMITTVLYDIYDLFLKPRRKP